MVCILCGKKAEYIFFHQYYCDEHSSEEAQKYRDTIGIYDIGNRL
jgi:hypothetical protein